MAKKNMSISIDPEQVMYTNISKSKDGYNSARVVVKAGEKEYMSISYEWEGDSVPDFAMGLMGFMQANEIKTGIVEEQAEAYDEYAAKMKKKPMDDEEDMEDMEDEEDMKKKKKDGKKKEC